MELREDLIEYIQEQIIPLYDLFDKGHGRGHVTYVIEESLRLASHYEVRKDMAYIIAAYHDLGLREGRKTHHIVSGRILREDTNLRKWFDSDEIEMMAQAAEDHRASASHYPRSIFGCIVAEADRQIDIDTILRRTVQYGLANYPDLDREQQRERALTHLHEKYGNNGYIKLYLDASSNARKLKQLQELMDDDTAIRRIIDDIIESEK